MKTQIFFADISRIKRYAKQLKKTHPAVSHGQLLDKASTEIVGVRSFHEALKLFDKTLMTHVYTPDGPYSVSYCSFCEFSFAADEREDRASHRHRHGQYQKATDALQYRPANAAQQQRMKREGHELASIGATLEERKQGLLQVIRSWFDRSLYTAFANDYWKKHPSFQRYTAMRLVELVGTYPDVTHHLIAEFGLIQGEIPYGGNYWTPRG